MKIVHLVNYIQPKLGYQEYFLAREHARMGHDVTVVTSDRYGRFPDYKNTVYPVLGNRIAGCGRFQEDGFEIIRLKTLFEIGSNVWLKGLCHTICSLKPDVVICHGIATFNASRIAGLKKKLKFRLIFDDHTLAFVANDGFLRKSFYRCFSFRKTVTQADKIIGVADECAGVIADRHGISSNRIKVVSLGADTNLFKFDDKLRKDFRNKFGIADDEVLITYTGRITPEKAPHRIIEAVNSIRNLLNRRITLLFVGNIEKCYIDIFEAYRKKSEGFAKVIMTPAVRNAELVQIYSASDIAVWPKQATASTIEALSCSLPVICIDAVSERCKNQNGIPVRPDRPEDLSNALLRLINDENLRLTMGKRSRELAEKELSWTAIAQMFLEK